MRKHIALLWLSVLVVAGGAASGCARNPLTGKMQVMWLSVQEEIQMGKDAAPEFEKEFGGRLPDPEVQAYVRAVGEKVAAPARKPEYPYEFSYTVLDSEVINAFALPGGPIYITRGLLANLEDESELAGVLAHETTHVAGRHSAAAISRQMAAEFVVGLASRGQGQETTAPSGGTSYGQTLLKIVGVLASLSYTRDQEAEADSYGVDYMTAAGYQPTGMARVMQMFEQVEQESGGGGLTFLRSHPAPQDRVKSIHQKIQKDHPGAETNPRLTVGREAYQERVVKRLKK